MEVAEALGRSGPSSLAERARQTVRARSAVFWVVVGLTALAAALRFGTLGLQAYHHDEIVTASRILRDGFWHAMDAVGFSESAPPLYYAVAWVWTQLTGTGEFGLRSISALAGVATVPVAYLARRRAAQPSRRPRRRRAGRGQPDAALVLAGGPRLRALLAARRRFRSSTSSARWARAAAVTSPAGGSRRRWRWRPTTSPSSRSPPRRPGCCAAEAWCRCAASGSLSSPACCWRRWRSTRCRSATPSGSATRFSSTGSGRRRSPSRSGRPATSSPARCTRSWRSCRWR